MRRVLSKVPRFVRASAAASIVAALAMAPYYYVDTFNVPKSAVRWPFNLSMFLFLLRTVEGMHIRKATAVAGDANVLT